MPTSDQILMGLTQISNEWQILAIFWHVYLAVLALALLAGLRPAAQWAGILLALPLFSVSVLAWSIANPFNGTLFAIAGIALVAIAFRLGDEAVEIAPTWIVAAGVLMFLFGLVYPHFLETNSYATYLWAAPTGLVPCPTLSAVIGLSLIVGGFNSRAWSLTLGAMGIFYGLFGALRLGVTLDFVLLLGALLMVLVAFLPRHHAPKQVLAH